MNGTTNESNHQAIKDLSSQLEGLVGSSVTPSESAPNQVDSITATESLKLVQKDRDNRVNFSETAVIKQLVVSQPPLEDRLKDKGEEVYGVVSDPEKALKKFKTLFGVEEMDGEVTFKNAADGNVSDAKKIYDILKESNQDPQKKVRIHVGPVSFAFKGGKLQMENGDEKFMTMENLHEVAIYQGLGYLKTPVATVELRVESARKNSSKKAVGAGAGRENGKKVLKSVSTSRIQGRKLLDKNNAIILYHKTLITDSVELKPGCKSEVSAKYVKTDKNGVPKVVTFRIPLKADMYKVEPREELIEVFGRGESRAAAATAFNANDEQAVKDKIAELSGIIAAACAAGIDSPITATLKENVATAGSKQTEAQIEQFGNV